MTGTETHLAHFAQSGWLWWALLPPLVWWARYVMGKQQDKQRYRDYADANLLDHLLVGQVGYAFHKRTWLWTWSLVWWLGVIAMAGPRWDFIEVEFDQTEASLVVILDISRSMDVADVKPSRLTLARQEIEDLINSAQQGGRNLRIGLVAFATTAHVVAPITDDSDALRHVLPYLNTQLSAQGGSRLGPALKAAQRLIQGHGNKHQAQNNKTQSHVLLVSDGDFAESDLNEAVAQFYQQGVHLHVLAVGTLKGGPVLRRVTENGEEKQQALIGPGGTPIQSHLPRSALQALAHQGGGLYMEADYLGHNAPLLLAEIDTRLTQSNGDAVHKGKRRIWNERYYGLLALLLIFISPWYLPTRRSV